MSRWRDRFMKINVFKNIWIGKWDKVNDGFYFDSLIYHYLTIYVLVMSVLIMWILKRERKGSKY